ncbi:TetR/AcrR family transcriptional regulator [Luteipulveratus sp. YIM 133132]|uniref:TetR/AcrR family transcriptional regulator n=1 Tax=Luteipulveratus flavus TaxID=3031728 RepID=A0ABT6C3N3_9MICO|nr:MULTISPECIES: TetR/AcrR family transcriptional regulator [unclassified Luteipulveratus]MDE9364048.1 TetR/AcrR family transcriptional regulator [Luteipulveratus sp. YIM 133132]MDF8263551.1 TetR/AcrR family transcriptional regulator [Luteipulveratus sp. YIM 133296]
MVTDEGATRPGPRERVVYTAVQHLREHGVEGTGLRALVADANAPWGSLRHYFPGGKDQIVVEALEWAGAFAAGEVERYLSKTRKPTPRGLLKAVLQWWIDDLSARDFTRGCPLAAAIADGADTNPEVCAAARRAFEGWAGPITAGLVSMGRPRREARELTTLLLASLEGAVLMARAQRSVEPLRVVERRLRPLF